MAKVMPQNIYDSCHVGWPPTCYLGLQLRDIWIYSCSFKLGIVPFNKLIIKKILVCYLGLSCWASIYKDDLSK